MADNYNILEPVTTPSGTQQRSIRALEISSKLHAAAVLVHGTSGAVLLGQSARADSVPVTIANEDTLALSRYRVSTYDTTNPTGTHVPPLPSGEVNDVTVGGTTQGVANDFLFTAAAGGARTINWEIPVVNAGYNTVAIIVQWSTAPVTSGVEISYIPNGVIVQATFTNAAGASRVLSMVNSEGAAYTAGATMAADTIARLAMEYGSLRTAYLRFTGLAGITGGSYRFTVIRSR